MFNLSPYRSAVILPLQDAAVARSVNHKLFAHWRTFVARYCFPVFEVNAYFLRSLGAWAPHGALALFSSSDELNPEDAHWLCLHAQPAVSDTPWAQDPLSCLYYLRLPQEEVLWQELRWDTNAQPFDESQALISELRKVRYRCLNPMREPVPNIPRLLAEGHPHRYLCTWNTPYFGMPALRARAYRPWKQYRDASNEICKIHFSARECI